MVPNPIRVDAALLMARFLAVTAIASTGGFEPSAKASLEVAEPIVSAVETERSSSLEPLGEPLGEPARAGATGPRS